jgi:homoserine O-acetyltransferase
MLIIKNNISQKIIMPKKIINIKPGCYLYSQTEPFNLVSGQSLNSLELAYETYGNLNNNKDNVILLHHSLSMSAHAANVHNQNNQESFDYNYKNDSGWWDNMIGSNKVLDLNNYFIICINNLGSCFGSTGPTNYQGKFPSITIHDIINSQKLLLDSLEINKIKLIIGSSVGGMLSLAWLQMYPDSLEKLFVAACSHKAYPANIFNRMIQQEIIKLARDNKSEGLKLARMLGYYNYRSHDELNQRFKNINIDADALIDYHDNPAYKTSELYSYFSYNADKFVNSFDSDSYLCMLNAMDLYDLTKLTSYHPAGYEKVNTKIDISITGIDSDILFPMWQQQEAYDLLVKSGYKPRFIEHKSLYGHDAFLIEHKEFGNYISDLLNK